MSISLLALPTEILSVIFRHSLSLTTDLRLNVHDDDTHDDSDTTWLNGSFDIPDHTKVLMKLAAICRLLRQAVRNDASLWTNIHGDMNFDLVLLYLQLSRQRLVSVHVLGKKIYSNDARPKVGFRNWSKYGMSDAVKRSVISTATYIFKQASRIRHMIFRFPNLDSIMDELIFIFGSIRPVLTHLETLSFRHFTGQRGPGKLQTLLANIPESLVALDLHNVTDMALPLISGPLRRLHLKLPYSPSPTGGVRELLSRLAPSLEELSYATEAHSIPFPPGPLIQMPHLCRLHIGGPTIQSSLNFLCNIVPSPSSESQIWIQTKHDQVEDPSWIATAKYLNRLYTRRPSNHFHFKYAENSFAFASADSQESFHIRSIPITATAINSLIETIDGALLARVVDLHIHEAEKPHISCYAPVVPESSLPWITMTHYFRNITSFTIDAGPWGKPQPFVRRHEVDYDEFLYAARPIHSALLTMFDSEEGDSEYFPHLRVLKFHGHRLLDPQDPGEKTLLEVIARRSQGKSISKIMLDQHCAISALFRRALAQVDAGTIVEMEGEVVPNALDSEEWTLRGSWIIGKANLAFRQRMQDNERALKMSKAPLPRGVINSRR